MQSTRVSNPSRVSKSGYGIGKKKDIIYFGCEKVGHVMRQCRCKDLKFLNKIKDQ